ncbi:MAG: TRAP transporter large permease subunit [Syntrophomonadaceae bacterium]|jgi:C4-dicarboxylate transporter DctM subunit
MDAALLSIIVTTAIIVIFLAIGINVGITLGIAGMVGITIFTGRIESGIGLPMLLSVSVTTTYSFVVIPLFVLLAAFASESQITTGLFNAAYKWMGRLPGGTAIATVITCAGMATLTGSSAATAATMARIALPELRRFNYDEALSVGVVTVGGTLAIMIPPSITFILYSIFAEQSIGKLLIAGILPGLVLACLFALMVAIRCIIKPGLAPKSQVFTMREKLTSLIGVIPFLVLVLTIILGILFGIWTPVEAAAVGVVAIFLMGLIKKEFTIKNLISGLVSSVVTSTWGFPDKTDSPELGFLTKS